MLKAHNIDDTVNYCEEWFCSGWKIVWVFHVDDSSYWLLQHVKNT